jgi:hypothetical protein
MNRNEGYYWIFGFVWSDSSSWLIAYWDGNYFWYDGDDFSEDSIIEIDERQIIRN